jgi:outer membrane protein assembly factor BamB
VTARSLILAPSGAFKRPETERKLVIRQTDADGILHLRRYAFRDGKAVLLNEGDADALVGATVRETLSMPDGRTALVLTGRDGTLGVWTWAGERLWDLPLAGGKRPTLSAADLDGDGRAELLTTTTADRLHVLSFDEHGQSERLFDHEFRGQSTFNRQSPLLYDLEGDGRLCLVTPVHTDDGRLAVRTLRADGSTLWETNLATSTSDGGRVVAWDAGECLPGPKPAIVVSVEKAGYTGEGSYCLDGVSGAIVWHKSLYGTGVSARPYRPRGIPTAFDVDGDGLEEIGFDMYSYMAWLRGRDGSFARIEHTRNLGAEDALYVGHLHHSFVPVFRHAADTKPHWFVPVGGYGPIGLMKPDPREGIWREETGADYPPKVGMIDVDGDGMMEVGYAVRGSTTFVCRDLWTGRVEWKLELPIALGDPVMTADVDGDGRGEFLAGRYCIGVNPAGEGTIRWTAPVSLDWAIIADFDGDGQGEIACPASGVVRILRAR